MGRLIFLDTDILIDLTHGVEGVLQAVQDLRDTGEELATTSVNVAEFLRGVEPGPTRIEARHLLNAFAEAPVGPRAAHRYGIFMQALDRAGHRIEETDGLIAAVVLEEGGRLMTRNARQFGRIPGLELLPLPS